MKFMKILGLAAVMAAAVMALVGPSSAFATGSTAICTTNTTPCTSVLAAGKNIKGTTSGKTAELTTKASGTVKCESTVEGKPTEGTSSTGVMGEVTSLAWAECTLGSEKCTVTSNATPYTSSITRTGTGVGTLTVTQKSGGSVPGATVVCGAIINCNYTINSSGAVLSLLDSTNVAGATAKAEKVALTGTGKACPASTWDAIYFLSEPTSLFLTT